MRSQANHCIHAPVHAWWSTKTLQRHRKGPVNGSDYTTGNVFMDTVTGDHMDAVHSIQVHQRISDILAKVRNKAY